MYGRSLKITDIKSALDASTDLEEYLDQWPCQLSTCTMKADEPRHACLPCLAKHLIGQLVGIIDEMFGDKKGPWQHE